MIIRRLFIWTIESGDTFGRHTTGVMEEVGVEYPI
jgi:hypothetical protein